MNFKFQCKTDEENPTTTLIEFDSENIGEITMYFVLFLRGVGFHQDSIDKAIGELL